jgi:VanZ family protein
MSPPFEARRNLPDRMSSIESRISPSTRITHYWIPVLLWLMFQFTFSTSVFSSDETSKFIVPLLKFILRNPTSEQLLFWHHVIRKAAHVSEYFILGMLVYRAFKIDMSKTALVGILTMIFVAVAATIDEYHQWFVPSRGSSIFDIGWDCIGGLIAITLLWIWRSSRAVEE